MDASESLSCENNNSSLFSAVPDSSNMYQNKDSNLISEQLSSFLGIITYLSQYMPNISSLISDLRGLLKKDALFQWYDVAFQKKKIRLVRMSVLGISIPLKCIAG